MGRTNKDSISWGAALSVDVIGNRLGGLVYANELMVKYLLRKNFYPIFVNMCFIFSKWCIVNYNIVRVYCSTVALFRIHFVRLYIIQYYVMIYITWMDLFCFCLFR